MIDLIDILNENKQYKILCLLPKQYLEIYDLFKSICILHEIFNNVFNNMILNRILNKKLENICFEQNYFKIKDFKYLINEINEILMKLNNLKFFKSFKIENNFDNFNSKIYLKFNEIDKDVNLYIKWRSNNE